MLIRNFVICFLAVNNY